MRCKFLGFALLVLLAGCHKKAAPPPPPIPTVQTAIATSKDVPYFLEGIGTVNAYNTVNILPRVTGQIVKIYFKEGDDVKKGDKLFIIDPRPYKAALDQSLALLAQSEAQLEYNKLTVESYRHLVPDDFVAPLTFEQYISNVKVTQAQVDQNVATAEANQLNVDYCHISSPIDGKTGLYLIDIGNMVFSNQTQPLLTINQLKPIYINFTLTEKQFPQLQDYLDKGPLDVQIIVPENHNKVYVAKLVFINNEIDNTTGTVTLRAEYPNTKEELWPGEFVNARVILYTLHNAVMVPKQAVQTDTKGHYIFVVNKDSTVSKVVVTLGQRFDGQQVILSGLHGSEEVVTLGQLNLSQGVKVKVKNTP